MELRLAEYKDYEASRSYTWTVGSDITVAF